MKLGRERHILPLEAPTGAAHMAGRAARMGVQNEAVLAGGGSQIPGMGDALGDAMKCSITTVDDPVTGNAVGFEAKAASIAVGRSRKSAPE